MLISTKTKIAAVIGDPIEHSLSPKLHNYLLEKHQIDGIYIPFRIQKTDLRQSLQSFAKIGLKGCNVTIPHKEETLKICDQLSKSASIIGAVNTVIVTADQKLYGHNSDGIGFINNIKQNQPSFTFEGKKVVMIGAGGAARAICYALIKEGVSQITIINRTVVKAEDLINEFKEKLQPQTKLLAKPYYAIETAFADCDLLINTTSLGMQGQPPLEISINKLPKNTLVTDIVYKPLITTLLYKAQERGNPTVTGIGMLINQALIGFEAWYGVKPEVDQKLIDQMIEWS